MPSFFSDSALAIKNGEHFTFDLKQSASDTLALIEAAQLAKKEGHPLVIICADPAEVTRLEDEIRWFSPQLQVRKFPDWETLPYDVLSPQESIVSERLETLYTLSENPHQIDVLICSALTAAQRLAHPSFIHQSAFFFNKGETISVEKLKSRLLEAGYDHVKEVLGAGEFATRGSLLDVFPMGSERPFRIDFFDEEIDDIRWFDIDTQRSMEPVETIRLLPGCEFPVDLEALNEFRARWRERFTGDPNKSLIYRDAGQQILSSGIEYYLPLFFDKLATIADYIPHGSPVFTIGDVSHALERFMHDTQERYRFLSSDTERPALRPDELWLKPDQFFTALKTFPRFSFNRSVSNDELGLMNSVFVERKSKNPLDRLIAFCDRARVEKRRVLIMAASVGRMETMAELFRSSGLQAVEALHWDDFLNASAPVMLTHGPLYRAFFGHTQEALCVLTETELYAASPIRSRRRYAKHTTNLEMMVRDISELKVGDPVVHVEHGIGRYLGLEHIDTEEGQAEFLRLEYKNDAKLFVPVTNLHLISRYAGADQQTAPLHSLGRGEWEKAKRKAAEQVRDTAAELLALYAQREQKKGFVFSVTPADYDAFSEGFPFEETPDQLLAIENVIKDMTSDKAMDRLVCGDVGFGKTEVALRAAFVAVMSGKQVAILCPTTLLAEQHAQSFKDRFAAWPIKVAELSRFRTGKETTATLKGLANGTIDIVIGTHKLLGDTVSFDRLGLVVIDEEHRFGVHQKEKLKHLRAEVDILTLTATPIPRTLSMSLEGIRDFSIIATAPERRLPIKTMVQAESKSVVREAVLRELKRGGQVYILHNEVSTILNRLQELEELIPEARIVVAHGQLNERDLERIMREFYQQHFNVLLCTTIIETGIDVPSANTIIIERADKFGLAQLHQLRGRVGRSYHQAYAYLLTPASGVATKSADKRLEAIQSLEDLGSGFYLAMHDLEIRGAGEILGEHQSGEIAQIGFDLYNKMLLSTVNAMKRGEVPDLEGSLIKSAEINLHAPALIPSDYMPDVALRLGFYKELSSANTLEAITQSAEALIDRYGKLPEPAKRLMAIHQLRIRCEAIGIKKIDCADSATVITFESRPNFEPLKLIELLQKRSDARMIGPEKLRFNLLNDTPQKRIDFLNHLLSHFE